MTVKISFVVKKKINFFVTSLYETGGDETHTTKQNIMIISYIMIISCVTHSYETGGEGIHTIKPTTMIILCVAHSYEKRVGKKKYHEANDNDHFLRYSSPRK